MAHEHHHGHDGEEASPLLKIILSAVLFAAGLFLAGTAGTVCFLLSYAIIGYEVLFGAARNIVRGELFDETFLMALASLGAIAISEYEEAAAVMILYELGEYLQDKAVDSSRDSIRALMDIRPDSARIVEDGKTHEIAAKEVVPGTIVEVRAGERIPLDGVVVSGASSLDTAALTGESLPCEVSEGNEVLSGCVNLSGTLHFRVTKPYGEDSASRILALVEHAEEGKSEQERFITRFAHIYTPVVVILAALLAFVPPMLGVGALSEYVRRALNFLVISCPCALVISIPLTFFSGIGCASHRGILVKGGNHLDTLARVNVAAFDKTGTLSEGKFTVSELLCSDGVSEAELLALAAYGESQSMHPLAQSIVAAYGETIEQERLTETQEASGHGVKTLLDGKLLIVGKKAFLAENGIELTASPEANATSVFVSYDGSFCGAVLLRDEAKKDARRAISELKCLGITKTVMLTGDNASAAERIAEEVGIDEVKSGLLPGEKLQAVEQIRKNIRQAVLLYAGDGINDTPVLKAADVGIAMGGLGTDAAMEAADIVIMGDEPGKIAEGIRIARKTMKIAKENIVLSIAIKSLVLLLSSLGFVALWAAVFADVGVCMIAIVNSLRAMR